MFQTPASSSSALHVALFGRRGDVPSAGLLQLTARRQNVHETVHDDASVR
jgi:hypothetical protein